MVYAIIILLIVPAVLGNSGGPPVSGNANLCTDMIPTGHNSGTSQATDMASPPYSITTSADKYTAGGSLTVTITGTGGSMFKGFFIQARRADSTRDNDVAIGTFASSPTGTQLLECHNVANSAWGHSNSADKSTVTATWNAPAQDEGPIEFKATIVKGVPDRNYFYLGVKSAQASFMAGGDVTNATPAAGDVTTQAQTTQAQTTSGGPNHTVSLALTSLALILVSFVALRRQ